MAASAKYRGLYPTMPSDDRLIAIDDNVKGLGNSRVVVESAIHDCMNVIRLGLTQSGHVHEHKVIGMDLVKDSAVLGNHRLVHAFIQGSQLLLIVTCPHGQKPKPLSHFSTLSRPERTSWP